MTRNNWNGRRTLEHCGLITKAVKSGIGKPKQYSETCEGYQVSDTDDEPCEQCKECTLQADYKNTHDDEMLNEYARSGY